MVLVRQKDRQKPIQLKRKATGGTNAGLESNFGCSVVTKLGRNFWGELTEEGQHEDSVVANSKLIGVAEVVPGGEVVVLLHRMDKVKTWILGKWDKKKKKKVAHEVHKSIDVLQNMFANPCSLNSILGCCHFPNQAGEGQQSSIRNTLK